MVLCMGVLQYVHQTNEVSTKSSQYKQAMHKVEKTCFHTPEKKFSTQSATVTEVKSVPCILPLEVPIQCVLVVLESMLIVYIRFYILFLRKQWFVQYCSIVLITTKITPQCKSHPLSNGLLLFSVKSCLWTSLQTKPTFIAVTETK